MNRCVLSAVLKDGTLLLHRIFFGKLFHRSQNTKCTVTICHTFSDFPSCQYQTDDLDAVIVAALLNAHCVIHSAPSVAKVDKLKRPTIGLAGTSEEWTYFKTRWENYVDGTNISGKEYVVQLLECCDEDLRRDLTRTHGSLTDKPKDEVFTAIKNLAVREENKMVARVALQNMRQDRDEAIRSYAARLRGQANICDFAMKCSHCNHEVNYMDEMIRDALMRGLADDDIQLSLLGDSNQDPSLTEVLKFVETKESGKRSAAQLIDSHGIESARTSYRQKGHKASREKKIDQTEICSYCGKTGHGQKATPAIRKKSCDAYGHTCSHCKKRHHLEELCRSRSNAKTGYQASTEDDQGTVFDTLCTIGASDKGAACNLILEHHTCNSLTNTWVKRASRPQPFIKITVSICQDDYTALGHPFPVVPKSITAFGMADIGCQSCLTGVNLVKRLGFTKAQLVLVTMKMHAANSRGIKILGAIIAQLSAKTKNGERVTTKQIIYITDDSKKLFLSQEACIALQIIPNNFPAIGEAKPHPKSLTVNATINRSETQVHNQTGLTSPCECPRRQLPPTPPRKLPFPATEANKSKLKDYLLDYYRSRTFNTCPHQPLPMMTGPPLRLMVDPEANPVAFHTPIPVALHWQDDVKQGLEQDIKLGVIEKVPVGEPVTWCHRMVICAKKNGKPRRTVDFQPLNLHATHETHHTQSPFHQARSVPSSTRKTVFDAWNGYHSVPLHPDDRHLTKFITPWGRYRYLVAPQGYIASGDGYSRRYDEIVADIPRKTKCIDDTLLWSNSIEECFFQAVHWLDICGKNGITLNQDKFVFAEETVEFAGFEITTDSVRSCKKYLQAITDFPTPKNISDIRSWFGLVNQVSYAFSMAPTMLPFRQLLKPAKSFSWDDSLNEAFKESKEVIVREIQKGVRIFDKSKPTCLATDWSNSGIGFWLFQKHCHCADTKPFCCRQGWQITLVESRFTHAAESRYAPVEGEALAVADALDKARFFVLGCEELIVAVDHKPLLKIFGDQSLDDISNTRLRNLKEKTLRYKNLHHSCAWGTSLCC